MPYTDNLSPERMMHAAKTAGADRKRAIEGNRGRIPGEAHTEFVPGGTAFRWMRRSPRKWPCSSAPMWPHGRYDSRI